MKKIILLSLLFLFSCQETGNENEGKSELNNFIINKAAQKKKDETVKVTSRGRGKTGSTVYLYNSSSHEINLKFYVNSKLIYTAYLDVGASISRNDYQLDEMEIIGGVIYFDMNDYTFYNTLTAPEISFTWSTENFNPTLSWTQLNGALSYDIYRNLYPSGYVKIAYTSSNTFVDLYRKSGTSSTGSDFHYTDYKVKAIYSAGESAFSNEIFSLKTVENTGGIGD